MIEFRICEGIPVLITPGAHPVKEWVEIGCSGEDIALVKLYCRQDGQVIQSPVLSGRALFDSGFIRDGMTYLPELIKAGESRGVQGVCFKEFSKDKRMYLCPVSDGTDREIADMWRIIAACFSMAEQTRDLCRETQSALQRLEKGYRTE